MTSTIDSDPQFEALLAMYGRNDHVLQGSPIATFVLDAMHTVVCWNRACEHVTGVRATEITGTRRHWTAFYPSERPLLADLIIDGGVEECIEQHYDTTWWRSTVIAGAYESEALFPQMGDRGKWLLITAAPLMDHKGAVVGAIETLQDITERKWAEAALHQYQQNLEELVRQRTQELVQAHRELADKAAILEQANEELSQYAFVASHDLRAPLRAIRNYTDFLHGELAVYLNEDQQGYFDGLGTALTQGEQLVNDLLEYSRIGNAAVTTYPVLMEELFAELVQQLDVPATAELEIAPGLPGVRGDRTLLLQIFTNLVDNGFKFNQSLLRRVEIGLATHNDTMCEIFVRDNGIGIDTVYHDRIFKMFRRLHTHKEFHGTGIGLAIVKKALTKIGGSIRVESSPGNGSCFLVTLPLAQTEVPL